VSGHAAGYTIRTMSFARKLFLDFILNGRGNFVTSSRLRARPPSTDKFTLNYTIRKACLIFFEKNIDFSSRTGKTFTIFIFLFFRPS